MTISASVVEFGILCYALHYMWRLQILPLWLKIMIVSSLLYLNLDVAKYTIDDNDSESSGGVAPGIT